MCTQFQHVNFADFSSFARKPSKLLKSRILLREILKCNYMFNYYLLKHRATVSVSTQTEIALSGGHEKSEMEVVKETFFRDHY